LPLWTAAALQAATQATCHFAASGVSIDSRTVVPGELFVALVGDNGDGRVSLGPSLG
jgi:UDP-N-acetylmuramoyl-tripeptide--D-alanyl-D-alanine ligase